MYFDLTSLECLKIEAFTFIRPKTNGLMKTDVSSFFFFFLELDVEQPFFRRCLVGALCYISYIIISMCVSN